MKKFQSFISSTGICLYILRTVLWKELWCEIFGFFLLSFPQKIYKQSKTNWAKLIYFSLVLRQQEEKKNISQLSWANHAYETFVPSFLDSRFIYCDAIWSKNHFSIFMSDERGQFPSFPTYFGTYIYYTTNNYLCETVII